MNVLYECQSVTVSVTPTAKQNDVMTLATRYQVDVNNNLYTRE